ncbi:mucin-2-like [Neocloeon triangulifer]|uniref:mucin-2-like n=1 Tax=Neocloeon triangulifer TaxID=2078957 RepID=UPI00286F6897|nr:mucin-2-like [Neocloeon triangulifer]
MTESSTTAVIPQNSENNNNQAASSSTEGNVSSSTTEGKISTQQVFEETTKSVTIAPNQMQTDGQNVASNSQISIIDQNTPSGPSTEKITTDAANTNPTDEPGVSENSSESSTLETATEDKVDSTESTTTPEFPIMKKSARSEILASDEPPQRDKPQKSVNCNNRAHFPPPWFYVPQPETRPSNEKVKLQGYFLVPFSFYPSAAQDASSEISTSSEPAVTTPTLPTAEERIA